MNRDRYEALPTGRPGLWLLRQDGAEIGTIAIIPGTIRHPTLHVQNMVHALNHPPAPATFASPALETLEAIRAEQRARQT